MSLWTFAALCALGHLAALPDCLPCHQSHQHLIILTLSQRVCRGIPWWSSLAVLLSHWAPCCVPIGEHLFSDHSFSWSVFFVYTPASILIHRCEHVWQGQRTILRYWAPPSSLFEIASVPPLSPAHELLGGRLSPVLL